MKEEDAAPKISISAIQSLEDVQVKLPSGVRIRINLDRATEEILAELKVPPTPRPAPARSCSNWRRKASTPSSSNPKK